MLCHERNKNMKKIQIIMLKLSDVLCIFIQATVEIAIYNVYKIKHLSEMNLY